MTGLRPFAALLRRELTRSARQPARLIATLGTAALLWLVLAGGLSGSISAATGYAAYLAPGIIAMVVLFTGIFGAMSLIEDRAEGFLQAVLVSPAPTWAIAGAKLLGASLWAWAQGLLILPTLWFRGEAEPSALLLTAPALLLLAIGATGICLAGAWAVRDSAAFHSIMNLVLMPMWLFSGAVFPTDGLARWMHALTRLNPMHWALEDIRALLTHQPTHALGLLAFAALGAALTMLTTTLARGQSRSPGHARVTTPHERST